jgi:hypothetical protein
MQNRRRIDSESVENTTLKTSLLARTNPRDPARPHNSAKEKTHLSLAGSSKTFWRVLSAQMSIDAANESSKSSLRKHICAGFNLCRSKQNENTVM